MADPAVDPAGAPAIPLGGDDLPGAQSNQALARGLHILRMLVDEGTAMTGTEIARRVGLHQSSVSRILSTLAEIGYVRKNDTGRFVPDYGVIALGAATTRLPLLTKPRAAMIELANSGSASLLVTMCMLWRDELIYLLRVSTGGDPFAYWGSSTFPLNVSSPALRLLLDLPEAEAVRILAGSRQRVGWGGQPEVPPTERGVLRAARRGLQHEVLILDQWFHHDQVGGAIRVDTPEPHPVALAVVARRDEVGANELRLLLHQGRRAVEQSFAGPDDG